MNNEPIIELKLSSRARISLSIKISRLIVTLTRTEESLAARVKISAQDTV